MTQLREPWARRGEAWDRARNSSVPRDSEEHLFDDHPEMVELLLTQFREQQTLARTHNTERLRLNLKLRREAE